MNLASISILNARHLKGLGKFEITRSNFSVSASLFVVTFKFATRNLALSAAASFCFSDVFLHHKRRQNRIAIFKLISVGVVPAV